MVNFNIMPRKKKDENIEKKIYKIVNIEDEDTGCYCCDKARVLNLDFIPDEYLEDLHDFDFIKVRLEYSLSTSELGMTPVVYICELDKDENLDDDEWIYEDCEIGNTIIKIPTDIKDIEEDE